jgi:uncharacterized membrane protein YgcG
VAVALRVSFKIRRNLAVCACLFMGSLVEISCTHKSPAEVTDWDIATAALTIGVRIADEADLLTVEQEMNLFQLVKELDSTLGPQVAIIIVDSLKGETIESFSLRKFEELNLGRDVINDGLVIIVSYFDRETRIGVGYGLEKIITDDIAATIIQEKMVPKFKEQRFYEGIYLAMIDIKHLIESHKSLIGGRL